MAGKKVALRQPERCPKIHTPPGYRFSSYHIPFLTWTSVFINASLIFLSTPLSTPVGLYRNLCPLSVHPAHLRSRSVTDITGCAPSQFPSSLLPQLSLLQRLSHFTNASADLLPFTTPKRVMRMLYPWFSTARDAKGWTLQRFLRLVSKR